MQDENHIELELKLRRSGAVEFRADARFTDTYRLQQVLDGLGLKDDPGWFEQRLHTMEKKVEALERGKYDPVDADFTAADRFPPREPEPQQDEEALVTALAELLSKSDKLWVDDARDILAHLRAQGLMRTAEDVELATQHRIQAANIRARQQECESLEAQVAHWKERASSSAAALEVEKSHRRALTQKAEEANQDREALARANLNQATTIAKQDNEIARLKADLATTEQAYQREQAARKEAEDALATAARLPNEGRIATQTDWDQRFTCLAAAERRAGEEHVARVEAQEAVRLAEKRAHEAGQEVARLSTELLEAKKKLEAAPKWAGGAPVTQEEWDRHAKMAAKHFGSDLQAKAARDG